MQTQARKKNSENRKALGLNQMQNLLDLVMGVKLPGNELMRFKISSMSSANQRRRRNVENEPSLNKQGCDGTIARGCPSSLLPVKNYFSF